MYLLGFGNPQSAALVTQRGASAGALSPLQLQLQQQREEAAGELLLQEGAEGTARPLPRPGAAALACSAGHDGKARKRTEDVEPTEGGAGEGAGHLPFSEARALVCAYVCERVMSTEGDSVDAREAAYCVCAGAREQWRQSQII